MKRIHQLFMLMAFTAIMVSCKKDVDELPPATQTGANTFGAKVNGEFWVPAKFGIAPGADILEARYLPNRDIIINARNLSASPNETEFEIYLKNVVSPGIYPLNSNSGKWPNHTGNYLYYVKRTVTPTSEWFTTSAYTGQIEITRTDTVNKIVSGLFHATMVNMYDVTQTMQVTEGRFDVKVD